ncbi:helix-turn-helix domain-containing protein [Solwaraspora sp. WMMD406]|uniref:GbsR/MarR family transcriptional regulator n=1 Tax=Solwaraspora sp. WMMD406 TaxID=3016095 RepID=UPI0024160F8A|nr:helix-turn-helix domain-containing protein [Solwaraspora sp. WMMD406]MDG4765008.1 helix-turn-helix domain-containing protein [Solwaraspora sp. WMMD406]
MLEELPPARRYAEEAGVVLGGMGLPPAAGKILGWLLICDPPSQTSTDLAAALELSKGSVSTSIRLLEQGGLVIRVPQPGRRGVAYQIEPTGLTKPEITNKFRIFRELLDRGVDLIGGPQARTSERLVYLRDFYAFIEREMPLIVQRFEAERRQSGKHPRTGKEARSDG